MYYDIVVDEDYDKACQLYLALVKVNCNKLLYPHPCFLRETVMNKGVFTLKYAYRIHKDNDGVYRYVTFLSRNESENFIPLRKFLNMLEETAIL